MKKFAFRILMAAALLALAACLASCDMGSGGAAGGASSPEGLYGVSAGGALSVRDKSKMTGAIVIPEEIGGVAVTSIAERAFEGCTGLTSIDIPSSVASIGSYAFLGCTGLAAVAIPPSVTSIGVRAFASCSGLASVAIPSSVTSIGGGAFIGCSALMSIGVDAGNADYRSEGGCLLSKDGTVFLACPGGLASVSVPSSVTSIGDEAFERCTGLASIEIPSSVTSIGKYAFLGCTGLASVSFAGAKSQWGAVRKGYCWHVYVPAAAVHCSDGDCSL